MVGPSSPFGTISWEHATLFTAYTQGASPICFEHDLALIHLAQPVGRAAGWMGMSAHCKEGRRYVATTAGYPGDKPAGTSMQTTCYLQQQACGEEEAVVKHKCDTVAGQSGSPMFGYVKPLNSTFVRAVLVGGYTAFDAPGNTYDTDNAAAIITAEKLMVMASWAGLKTALPNGKTGASASAAVPPAAAGSSLINGVGLH